MADDDNFLARWSRRKVQVKRGEVPSEDAAPVATPLPAAPLPTALDPAQVPAVPSDTPTRLLPEAPGATGQPEPAAPAAPALPTMEDVAGLTHGSDFSRFVAPGVNEGVKCAALKTLFSDPHFNVMDGLDVYIEDYGIPNPIPESMLRQMAQSKALRLFETDDDGEEASPDGARLAEVPQSDQAADAPSGGEAAAEPADVAGVEPTSDEDTDLRLQQDHAAGRTGPDEGTGSAGV